MPNKGGRPEDPKKTVKLARLLTEREKKPTASYQELADIVNHDLPKASKDRVSKKTVERWLKEYDEAQRQAENPPLF